MDFVRKLNVVQSVVDHNKKQNKTTRISSGEIKQQYANFLEEQHPGHRMTEKIIEANQKKQDQDKSLDKDSKYAISLLL